MRNSAARLLRWYRLFRLFHLNRQDQLSREERDACTTEEAQTAVDQSGCPGTATTGWDSGTSPLDFGLLRQCRDGSRYFCRTPRRRREPFYNIVVAAVGFPSPVFGPSLRTA